MKFSSPSSVIILASLVLVATLVFCSGSEVGGKLELDATWRVALTVVTSIFLTLHALLAAHLFVRSEYRRATAFIQCSSALLIIWVSFPYAWSFAGYAFDYVPYAPKPGEIIRVPPPRPTPRLPVFAKLDVEWGGIMLPAIVLMTAAFVRFYNRLVLERRYRLVLTACTLAWVATALAFFSQSESVIVSEQAGHTRVTRHDVSYAPSPSVPIAEASAEPSQTKRGEAPDSLSEIWPNPQVDPVANRFFLVALVGVFLLKWIVPLYFSIPFVQTLLAECTNTTKLVQVAVISAVVSVIAIFAAMQSDLPGMHNWSILLSGALALSIISIYVVKPVVADAPRAWVAGEVAAIVQYIALGLLYTPSASDSSSAHQRAFAFPWIVAALTAIHLLIGLYVPRQLNIIYRVNSGLYLATFVCGAILFLFWPHLLLLAAPYLLWIVVLCRLFPGEQHDIWALKARAFFDKQYAGTRRAVTEIWENSVRTVDPQPLVRPGVADSSTPTHPTDVTRQVRPTVAKHEIPIFTSIVAACSLMFAFILFVFAFGSIVRMPTRDRMEVFAVMVVAGMIAVLLIRRAVRITSTHVTIDGIQVTFMRGSRKQTVIQLREVVTCVIDADRRGIALRDLSGSQISMHRLEQTGFWQAAHSLQVRTLCSVMERVVSDIRYSGSTTLGPIRASWEGVTVQQRHLPWAELERIRTDPRGITITRTRASEPWVKFRWWQVPDILALQSLQLCVHFTNTIAAQLHGQVPSADELSLAMCSVESRRCLLRSGSQQSNQLIGALIAGELERAVQADLANFTTFLSNVPVREAAVTYAGRWLLAIEATAPRSTEVAQQPAAEPLVTETLPQDRLEG